MKKIIIIDGGPEDTNFRIFFATSGECNFVVTFQKI